MMKCTLCGFKFDELDRSQCECSCSFGGCGGDFLVCPQCGYHMVAPPDVKKRLKEIEGKNKNDTSLFSKIRQIF